MKFARGLGIVLLAASAVVLIPKSTSAQSKREADGARLLRGAVDVHFHMDATTPSGGSVQADIATVRVARDRGVRGLVIKNHFEPTATVAYLLRKEVPNIELFGGLVMNLSNGGMNPAGVDYMATQIAGAPGKIVWMPAGNSEIEARTAKEPNKPFVPVSRNGELLPATKQVLALIAKHNLTLASGHIAAEEALLVFREAKKMGVQRMIATHAMDLAGKMTLAQMQQAAQLGAIIEFDFRNILDDNAARVDAIKKLGAEHCLISEFWTKVQPPKIYGDPAGVGAFAEALRSRGITDRDLDIMFKDNPAKVLGLDPKGGKR
jgi:uncharacterized protein DUF6282